MSIDHLKRFPSLWLLALALLAPLAGLGQINVQRYDIWLNFDDLKNAELKGRTDVHFRRHNAAPALQLTLESYEVKAVRLKGKDTKFTRNDSLIVVPLPPPADRNAAFDTFTVTVEYAGKPAKPSWFGGVYFSDSVVYNLGVSIEGPVHSHGKAWFPCVDEFPDKARFRFWVTAPKGMSAICNGSLQKRETLPDGRERWHWTLRDEISPYLASFAVGTYTEIKDQWQSKGGPVPISIWVPPAFAAKAKQSFAKLKTTLTGFEQRFGPYRWERVGYVGVPMKGGAMEHATNIAYPLAALDGTDRMDRLWAHELAHSWFGNLVTCARPAEMWLNEGFARWAEAVYAEIHGGPEAYRKAIHELQFKVMEQTAIKDGGFFPVGEVPGNLTYGSTVYDKGALVVHNLRGWLGDSVFFAGLKLYMNKYGFDLSNNTLIQQTFAEASVMPMEPFFNTWVKGAGFPHFACDSMTVRKTGGSWTASLAMRQRLYHSSQPMFETRLPVWIMGADPKHVFKTLVDAPGAGQAVELQVPFEPKGVIVDPELIYTDAVLDRLCRVGTGDTVDFDQKGNCRLQMTRADAPRQLQIRYSYVQSDLTRQLPVRNVGERYWSVDGALGPNDQFQFIIMVDPGSLYAPNVRDELQQKAGELSTVLYFRPRKGGAWREIQRYPGFNAGMRMVFPDMAGTEAGDYAIAVTPN